MEKFYQKVKKNWLFWLLLFTGIGIRLYIFPDVLPGMNCDEAYALYESMNLLRYGTDSWGYHNPVYFNAWGSGMNILLSVLSVSFVATLGVNSLAVKLPVMLYFLITLPVFYLLVKETTKNKTAALMALGILVISPWHITMSRFALESNLAVPMYLFASYLFVKGIKNNWLYIPSAFFFGITLYAYATMWVVVPVTLIVLLAYLLKQKQFKLNIATITAVCVLIAISLPLILFVLVNAGVLPEIQSFISIPRLYSLRTGEISFRHIPANIAKYFTLLITGISPWQNFTNYGAYVCFPLIFIGLFIICEKVFRKQAEPAEYVFIVLYIILTIYGLCIFSLNENKINFLHFANTFLSAYGLHYLWYKLRQIRPRLEYVLVAIMAVTFFSGANVYFNVTPQALKDTPLVAYKIDEAIDFASQNGSTIYVDDYWSHKISYFLLNLEITPEEFLGKTVLSDIDNNGWLEAEAIYHDNDKFIFMKKDSKTVVDVHAAYLLNNDSERIGFLKEQGAKTKNIGYFTVAYFE